MFYDLTEYLLQALNCYRTISKHEQLNSHPLLKCKVVYEMLFLLICIDMPSWRFTYLAYFLHCKLRGPLRRENCFCWAALPKQKALSMCCILLPDGLLLLTVMQVSAFWVLSSDLDPALLEGVPFPIQLPDIRVIDDKAACVAV